MRRHPPFIGELTGEEMGRADVRCLKCEADVLDPIHWPPVGWRENLLHFFGVLR